MTSPTLARKAKLSSLPRPSSGSTSRSAASSSSPRPLPRPSSSSSSSAPSPRRTPDHLQAPPPSPRPRPSGSSNSIKAGARSCRLPGPVAKALLHYATVNATLRQTAAEVAVTARALASRAPCNLLVFGGLGPNSALWAALNHGGRTAFLEEDAASIAEATARHPGLGLESHQVAYQTTLDDADELLGLRSSPDCAASPPKDHPLSADHFESSPCKLAMRGLPAAFYETEWDVIIVDAPAGWVPEAPGRVGGAIYMAGMAARARRPWSGETDVMVHGVDRTVEDSFSKAFLCEGYIKEEVGRLRHFAIPSHMEKEGKPFCP